MLNESLMLIIKNRGDNFILEVFSSIKTGKISDYIRFVDLNTVHVSSLLSSIITKPLQK